MTAADDALATLRARILSGSLAAGHKLQQEDLAASLGMSRIPVRDAIRSLIAEGLVVQLPHRTAVVAPLTMEDLADLYELRLAVEPLASAVAVPNVVAADVMAMRNYLAAMEDVTDHAQWLDNNDGFHAVLYRRSGRPRMISLLDLARAQTRRYTGIRLGHEPPDLDSEHRLILKAVERRDAAVVRSLVEAHLHSGYSMVRQQLQGRSSLTRAVYGNPVSLEGGASGAGIR
ncbi:MAG TPA: GntR family transcriptional regulator [Acidimicrobiia bacterium]|nr:GntR family transcriptional regulator [Acidimicrobiia bacterium]